MKNIDNIIIIIPTKKPLLFIFLFPFNITSGINSKTKININIPKVIAIINYQRKS